MKFPKRSWLGAPSIGRALLTLTTVFILTLFGILLYTVTTIQNQKLDSVMLDLAGRQRMLNQRIMKEVLLTTQGIPADYLFTRNILNQTLEALMFGGEAVVNLSTAEKVTLPPAPTQNILQVLGEQKTLISEFSAKTDRLFKIKSDHPEFYLELDSLLALNARLNEVANKAVKLFSRNSQEKISQMILWESLVGLLAGFFGVLLTRQVRLANRELTHEIQERSRAETALRHRMEIENLVANLSTQFINLRPEELDAGINRALEAIGTFG
ncbi:MAG: type IV pili methyl-accepting chemotaxis transducer N-terminal domain-containing protein, partial [Nitrospirota bacterium]|nr:type IV pili methyl-accepting chemotaxis transducer N-terminal domain-containing protein [Nitrospirota bacterium]